MKKRLLFILPFISLLLVSVDNIKAQVNCPQCESIKKNSKYYWAQSAGTFQTMEEARQSAMHSLGTNIQTFVVSEFKNDVSTVITDQDHKSTDSRESRARSYSNVILQDLNVIELQQEPNAMVFCYVEKSRVKTVFEERANQVVDFVESGKLAEQRLQIDDALKFYNWALSLAVTLPDPVEVSFDGKKGKAINILPMKIRSVLNTLRCVTESTTDDGYGGCDAILKFTYNGKPVSSVCFKYNDGQSWIGPNYAKDGIADVHFVRKPIDKKVGIVYEYRFLEEAKQLMPGIFDHISPLTFNAASQFGSFDGSNSMKSSNSTSSSNPAPEINPEKAKRSVHMAMDTVGNAAAYATAMQAFEKAITNKRPEEARQYMTEECYGLFKKLINNTGQQVKLYGKQEYSYLDAGNMILARFMKVSLRVSGGKTINDKLVFRFSPKDKKAFSFAFGLTDIAENDIFSAAKNWSSVSRYTILNFMEDYQTAFALRRIDFMEKVFSEDAIIILGTELKTVPRKQTDGGAVKLSDRQIKYNKYTKQQYLSRLRNQFNTYKYIHLTFENNETCLINTEGTTRDDAAFAIQIAQTYSSSHYSDRGYLTLMLNLQGEYPMIVVRYWQPEKEDKVNMGSFFSSDNFSW
ncbi:MAG: hypothetical protein J6Y98_10195 [Bacteroidales bacterium]|nr:hypothetical protein [Bacteroidales bacterium]